jgi:hypothetical protein
MPKVQEVIERLKSLYQPDEHIAVAIWCEDDVIQQADGRNVSLTRAEAQEILDTIERKQDCSIGISWDVLDVYIDELVNSPHR